MNPRAVTAALLLLLAGCASGPEYSVIASSLPSVAPDRARIIFFRESGFTGSGNVARIHIDGMQVGAMPNGSVLWLDRAPGNIEVMVNSALLFGSYTLPLTIEAGKEHYVEIAAPGQGLGPAGALPYLAQATASEGGRYTCGGGWCGGMVTKEFAMPKMQELKVQQPEP